MKLLTHTEYRKTIISILFTIDEICRKHNLCYMLYYGTLLGAVRHKGMIPWDDDIDIVMPRTDYETLSRLLSCGEYPINFIDINNSEDTIYPYGKICDKSTVLYEKNFKSVKGYGAFVDVFPLDYAPNQYAKRIIEKEYLKTLVKFETHCARTNFEKTQSAKTNILRGGIFAVSRLVNPQLLIKKINKFVIKRDKTKTNYYRVLGGGIFPVEWLNSTSEVEFEGRMLLGPHNPDVVLRACFGDYMTLPPEHERVNKHSFECYYR